MQVASFIWTRVTDLYNVTDTKVQLGKNPTRKYRIPRLVTILMMLRECFSTFKLQVLGLASPYTTTVSFSGRLAHRRSVLNHYLAVTLCLNPL